MEKKKTAVPAFLGVAAVWIGSHFGPGFATGAFSVRWYVKYGWVGLVTPLLAMFVTGGVMYYMLEYAREHGTPGYNIFMAMVEKVGHDKRGNPTFKRDKEGNEILVPDTNSVLVLGTTGEGDRTVSHEQKRKVEDDQTPDVPAIFAEWKIKEGLAW